MDSSRAKPLLVRLPPDLRRRLEREAEDAGLSLSALIVTRLGGTPIRPGPRLRLSHWGQSEVAAARPLAQEGDRNDRPKQRRRIIKKNKGRAST
jgi:hypothetical protein